MRCQFTGHSTDSPAPTLHVPVHVADHGVAACTHVNLDMLHRKALLPSKECVDRPRTSGKQVLEGGVERAQVPLARRSLTQVGLALKESELTSRTRPRVCGGCRGENVNFYSWQQLDLYRGATM